jgi:zinc protease
MAAVDPSGVPEATPAVVRRPARRTTEESGVFVYDGPGSVPILVRVKPDAPLAHVGVFAAGGATNESADLAGLTMLMARSAARGSEKRGALRISEESELLGGSISASVGGDSFGWSISVPSRNIEAATELLFDVTQHPSFPDDVIETERAAAIAAVKSLRDDMYRYPMRMAAHAAYEGHPYGVPVSGTEESLARISRDNLVLWHHSRALEGPTCIGVVGDGNPDDLAAMVAGACRRLVHGAAVAPEAPDWPAERREVVEARTRAQSAIAMLFPAPGRQHPDRFAASLIAAITSGLGGRFFDELREKRSLCYTINTFLSERWRSGAFVSYIATSPDKETAARDGLLEEFSKLRESGVTEEELSRAQTYAIGVHQIRMQSGGAVLGEMVDAFLFGSLGELDRVDENVRAVTRDDVLRIARNCFDPARRVEAIVRGVSP